MIRKTQKIPSDHRTYGKTYRTAKIVLIRVFKFISLLPIRTQTHCFLKPLKPKNCVSDQYFSILSAHYWVRYRLYRWAGQHTSPYLRPVMRKTRQLTRLKIRQAQLLCSDLKSREFTIVYCLLQKTKTQTSMRGCTVDPRSRFSHHTKT